MDYKTWKNNYEAEFEAHRKANYRLIYRYQSDYQKYLNDPNWIQVGDFCNFHRVGTLHIGAEITAKYEKLMLENIEVFEGFCLDEFNRIRVYNEVCGDDEDFFGNACKIFEYSNMSVRFDDLSSEQKIVFVSALKSHLDEHEDAINLFRDFKLKKLSGEL